jgi:hypothetical protein
MSTKIYEAYMIPLARLGEWQEFFHNGCRKYIVGMLWKCEVPEDKENIFRSRRDPFLAELGDNKDVYSKKEVSLCWGLSRWLEESKSGKIGAFNFDSSFNFWTYDGMVYIIPYWPCGMKAMVPDWCEEYRYWDNSDHPENISYEEWKERGEVWDKLALKNWDKGRMSHVAFEGKRISLCSDYIGIWELINEFCNDDKAKDIIYCGTHQFINIGVEEKVGKRDE